MASTGWTDATKVDAASDFTNPTYIITSDGNRATSATVNQFIIAHDFGWPAVIASAAGEYTVVDSIQCQLQAKLAGFGGGINGTITVDLSVDGGTSWEAHTKSESWTTTTEVYKTVTAFEDTANRWTWARVWTAAELTDANFRCRMTLTAISPFVTFHANHLQMQMDYWPLRHIQGAALQDAERLVGIG
jgi:hypothetical protein